MPAEERDARLGRRPERADSAELPQGDSADREALGCGAGHAGSDVTIAGSPGRSAPRSQHPRHPPRPPAAFSACSASARSFFATESLDASLFRAAAAWSRLPRERAAAMREIASGVKTAFARPMSRLQQAGARIARA